MVHLQVLQGARRPATAWPPTSAWRPPAGKLSLRVSVVSHCQLACPYCRPGTLAPATTRDRLLTPAAYHRLARALPYPVGKVRFTGGEPLLRPDFPEIVAAFADALPGCDLAVTTNGQLLTRRLPALHAAGLRRATVHVDSLRPGRYRELMGEGDVHEVLQGALDARACLDQVKLNVVVQRDRNDDELRDFLDWSRRTGVEVRFIELMNTGSAVAYTRRAFVSGREIVRRLGATPLQRRSPGDPASLWRAPDGVVFGVIASDTEPFCEACDRIRVSADGSLRGCLYAQPVSIARALETADDQALARAVHDVIAVKVSHHPLQARDRSPFSMADVGG